MVEEGSQLIVAQQVGQNAADNGSLIEMVDQVEQNTGSKPECLLADAGYRGEANFLALEQRKIEAIVALRRESKAVREEKKKNNTAAEAASERMAKRLEEQRGKQQYARRKGMVEPAFGWVKEVLGFRRFSLRGLKKVQGEWSLVTMALNLRRMAKMEAFATVA